MRLHTRVLFQLSGHSQKMTMRKFSIDHSNLPMTSVIEPSEPSEELHADTQIKPEKNIKRDKNNENYSSIEEQALFSHVLTKMEQFERQRHDAESDIGDRVRKFNTQIVFANKAETDLSDRDKRIRDLYLATVGEPRRKSIFQLINEDIRTQPMSSRIAVETEEGKTRTRLNELSARSLENVTETSENSIFQPIPFDLEIPKKNLEAIERKERYKAILFASLEPYLKNLLENLKTDYQVLTSLESMLVEFSHRDKRQDSLHASSTSKLMNHIKSQSETYPSKIPEPLVVTIPFLIVKLCDGETVPLPRDRILSFLTYIYDYCKRNSDISMYLNVCDVDFYNALIKFHWDCFKEIPEIQRLTNEMNINGILGDIYTVEILDNIVEEIRSIDNQFDVIPDQHDLERSAKSEPKASMGWIWCKEYTPVLMMVERYLTTLKRNLTY